MPLVRFGVKNEYGLGVEELYKDGVQSEDPKAVLDGVAVAGLVGLLRQLGDLAQFAAEVFHGLQEQVAYTSSRSRKLVNRVQRIEASLPSIEKSILSQTDHLHFAYTPGTEWHASTKDERNHFISDDLPHFIMDSYEECREPPRLQLLDRFETGGPGTCLKRYTDPTFFKRASSCSEDSNAEKSQREKKTHKIKKRSRQRSAHFTKSGSNLNGSSRMQFSATGQGQSSLSHTASTFETTFKSDLGDQSDSRGSRNGPDFLDTVSRSSISAKPDPKKDTGLSSSVRESEVNTNGSLYLNDFTAVTNDKPCSDDVEATSPRAFSATWDEKLDMLENINDNHDNEDTRERVPLTNSSLPDHEFQLVKRENDVSDQGSSPISREDESNSSRNFMEQTKLYYGFNEVPHFLKSNFDLQENHLKPVYLKPESQLGEIPRDSTINGNVNGQYLLEADIGVSENDSGTNDIEHGSETDGCIEDNSNVRRIEWDHKEEEIVNRLDLGIVNSEHVSEGDDASSEGRSNVDVIGWREMELKTIDADHDHHGDDAIFEGGNDMKRIKWNDGELETQNDENVGQVQVIERNQVDDIDSGTENFVDALYTIESESESEFELEFKKKIQPTPSRDEIGDIGNPSKPEHQPLSTSYVHTEMKEVQEEEAPEDEEVANAIEQHLSTSNHHEQDDLEELENVEDSVSLPKNELESTEDQKFHEITKIPSPNFPGDCDFGTNKPEIELEHVVSESTDDQKLHEITKIPSPSNVPRDRDFYTNEPEIELQPEISESKSGSEEISVGSSSTYPPAFWTNGTLFGLQPSKPTVGAPNSVDSGPTSQNSKNLYHQKFAGHENGKLRDHLPFLDPNTDNVKPLESKVVLDTNVKNSSSEASATNEDRSSLLSLLSRGLLKNSLRRSGSLNYDETLKSTSSSKSNHSNNGFQDSVVSESNRKLTSPINSPPPSPPLEHMKLSFQPVNGFDNSRLRLKYPEGVDYIENSLDAFPSFQLIPEPSSLKHDIGSDSDDDTFCQSHAYVSDGSHSQVSDSDSEQWESGNSGESNGVNIYNGLNRISSAEFASISPLHEVEDHGFVRGILDAKNQVDFQDMKICLKPGMDSLHSQEAIHEPPPLPPLQWRVSRPQFDEGEGNHVLGSDTLSQPFVPKRLDSVIDDSALVGSTKLISRVQQSSTIAIPKKEEEIKQEQTCNTVKERSVDDGGDFLQQIRTKSFNLKRTEPIRTNSAPIPTTSNKITAILHKANAIRQAVGSDDGEDDSWSDT